MRLGVGAFAPTGALLPTLLVKSRAQFGRARRGDRAIMARVGEPATPAGGSSVLSVGCSSRDLIRGHDAAPEAAAAAAGFGRLSGECVEGGETGSL